jgi:hypothetical protein
MKRRILKACCPSCKSIAIDRVNTDVKVYQGFTIEESIDFRVADGEEHQCVSMYLQADESEPPYIEELDSGDLDFICGDCGYYFENAGDETDFIELVLAEGWIKWVEVNDDEN